MWLRMDSRMSPVALLGTAEINTPSTTVRTGRINESPTARGQLDGLRRDGPRGTERGKEAGEGGCLRKQRHEEVIS